jgi:hypothetical protein
VCIGCDCDSDDGVGVGGSDNDDCGSDGDDGDNGGAGNDKWVDVKGVLLFSSCADNEKLMLRNDNHVVLV